MLSSTQDFGLQDARIRKSVKSICISLKKPLLSNLTQLSWFPGGRPFRWALGRSEPPRPHS
jgi:hypothetical protein